MLAEETVLNLFDSYWFRHEIFTSTPPLVSTVNISTDPVLEDHHEDFKSDEKPKLDRTTSLMRKSYSDEFLSSKGDKVSLESPKSVLNMPHDQLQTILSGKKVDSFQEMSIDIVNRDNSGELFRRVEKDKTKGFSIRRKLRKSNSRSMSELEFEELKGFMDLGFVFSDEEKDDSRLVSIIPGLQRLGKNSSIDCNVVEDQSDQKRPYLSEAWGSLEDRNRVTKNSTLMDWRIPAFGNEMELKNHLRFWAHSVASIVV